MTYLKQSNLRVYNVEFNMENSIIAVLQESKSSLRAIDIVRQLKAKKDISTSKHDVNKILYSKLEIFSKEKGQVPPKWCLAPNASLPTIRSRDIRIFIAESPPIKVDNEEEMIYPTEGDGPDHSMQPLLSSIINALIENGYDKLEFDENTKVGKEAKNIYQTVITLCKKNSNKLVDTKN